MAGTAGLASAQVSNFTGWTGAVNLSATSTNTKVGTVVMGVGGDNVIGSLQGAYSLELSSSSVLGFGLTYAAGKSKSGSFKGGSDTYSISVKNQYSLYIEPGTLLSDNTLFYGKISVEKGKLAPTSSNPSDDNPIKSISGTGYGVGMRHMLDKSKFVQLELMKAGYKSFRYPGETTDIKASSTLGTIGIGMKF